MKYIIYVYESVIINTMNLLYIINNICQKMHIYQFLCSSMEWKGSICVSLLLVELVDG